MTEDNAPPISVTALRADDYSPDAKSVIISLATKYSTAERKYSVPLECFYDFIIDLKRLNALKAATPIEATSEPADTSKPVEDGLECTGQLNQSPVGSNGNAGTASTGQSSPTKG